MYPPGRIRDTIEVISGDTWQVLSFRELARIYISAPPIAEIAHQRIVTEVGYARGITRLSVPIDQSVSRYPSTMVLHFNVAGEVSLSLGESV